MTKRLSPIEQLAAAGKPIYVVEGRHSGNPEIYGPDVPAGVTEWQFSDGPAGERSYSEDYLDIMEGFKTYRRVNPKAIFIIDSEDSV